jgi:hypothetical protein
LTFFHVVVYFAIVVFEIGALRTHLILQWKEVKRMKKLISLALCLMLAVAFAAGCKKKEEAPAAPAVEQKAPEAQAPMTSAAAPAAPEAAPAAPAAPAEKH